MVVGSAMHRNLAVFAGIGLGVAIVGSGWEARAQPSADIQRSQIALMAFQLNAARDADAKRGDATTRSLRRQAEVLNVSLKKTQKDVEDARARANGYSAQVQKLEAKLSEEQDHFTEAVKTFSDALALKDTQFAAERTALMNAAQGLLQTPDGQRALRLLAEDTSLSNTEASVILDALFRTRREVDVRSLSQLYFKIRGQGLATRGRTAQLYEEVVKYKSANSLDWLHLAILYKEMGEAEKAVEAARGSVKTAADDQELSFALRELGGSLILARDYAGAIEAYHERAKILGTLSRIYDIGGDLSETLIGIALIQYDLGNLDATQATLLDASRNVEDWLKADPESLEAKSSLASVYLAKATIESAVGNSFTSLSFAQRCVEIMRSIEKVYNSPVVVKTLALSIETLADVKFNLEQYSESLSLQSEAITIRTTLAESDTTWTDQSISLASSIRMRGFILMAMRDIKNSDVNFTESETILRKITSNDAKINLSKSLLAHSMIYHFWNDKSKAISSLLEAKDALKPIVDGPLSDAMPGRMYASVLTQLSVIERENGNGKLSANYIAEALSVSRKVFKEYPNSQNRTSLATTLEQAARTEYDASTLENAMPLIHEIVDIRRTMSEEYSHNATVRSDYANLLAELAESDVPGFTWRRASEAFERIRGDKLLLNSDLETAAQAKKRARREPSS
jgi:hypothetical protein